uniref:Histone-lysine N-methyltransferase SETMAR n=1 Tax=Ascaris lumbricoides TaxID=6252 RepID=A0A0M3IRT6_ASCLU
MIESESILHHYESHHGFNAKARQVLLEPLPPFVVSEKRINTGSSSIPCSPIAPHRGFNLKAREVLICRNATPLQPFKLSKSFLGGIPNKAYFYENQIF